MRRSAATLIYAAVHRHYEPDPSGVPAASEGALDLIDRSRERLVAAGEFFATTDQVSHRSWSQLQPFTQGGQRETAFLGAQPG